MTYFFLIPLICHFSLHLPQCSGHIDCSKLFYNKLKHLNTNSTSYFLFIIFFCNFVSLHFYCICSQSLWFAFPTIVMDALYPYPFKLSLIVEIGLLQGRMRGGGRGRGRGPGGGRGGPNFGKFWEGPREHPSSFGQNYTEKSISQSSPPLPQT